MLSLEQIVNETGAVRAALLRRGEQPPIDEVIKLDTRRRRLIREAETLRARRNKVSSAIGREKRPPTASETADMRADGQRIKAIEADLDRVQESLNQILLAIPNLPLESTPDGLDESANTVARVGREARPNDAAKPHWDLGQELGIIDMEAGARISGARFYVLKGKGARLHRALANWLLDTLTSEFGYTEIAPPLLVRADTMTGSGNLPKFRDNLYRDDETGLWLVPTAEVALNALHQGQIIEPHLLPLKYVACTPCFRKEHTAAGRDVRGIKRVHQFDKVEMFRFVQPETSEEALKEMVEQATTLCDRLGLPHRVVELCAGDLGFQSAKTYDVEVWAPGCKEWLEISSVSTCTDFQSRRNNTRYRPERGARTRFPHTLNGSALGMPRLLIAVLENGAQPDGTVDIPEPIRPYAGFERIP